MDFNHTFRCPVASGLHARPASRIVDAVKKYPAEVILVNKRTGMRVNAKSTLAIVSADIRGDDPCRFEVSGEKAKEALKALQGCVDRILPNLTEEMIPETDKGEISLPYSFQDLEADYHAGIPLVRGIGRGEVVVLANSQIPDTFPGLQQESPEKELAKHAQAIERVHHSIERQLNDTENDTRNGILNAHLSIVNDIELTKDTQARIESGESAAKSIVEATRLFCKQLRASENAYTRERAVDIEDIGLQILEELCEDSLPETTIHLTAPSVLVAQNMTPRQLLSTDRRLIRGLVFEKVGRTAHVIILAKSLGIPTLTEVAGARSAFVTGEEAIVDAHLGVAIRNPQSNTTRYYAREAEKHARRLARLTRSALADSGTDDGSGLKVSINANAVEDLESDKLAYADGIGLLRTETFFTDRQTSPAEEVQFELFKKAVKAAGNKPVIIRTYDVGADKPLPFFSVPPEGNPALGCRGIRAYREHPHLINAQLRAILRASAFGQVWLMAPMVSSVEEVYGFMHRIAETQEHLSSINVDYDPGMKIGIMVEVPTIVFSLDEVCKLVDFFSVGTNDLSQYLFAADRCNEFISPLANPRHPAFLRVLNTIVKTARKHDRWVGICGDMASNVRNLPLLGGLGLDEISVVASELLPILNKVKYQKQSDCREMLEKALTCETAYDVERLLDESMQSSPDETLLSAELVTIDADCDTKAEAIKHMVDELFVAGRTDNPQKLEETIWMREGDSTTGLGHGFAIPHCKTDAVSASSIVIAKLKKPVEWGSVDGNPVNTVIMLAMNERDRGNTHLKVFSTLARRLMHEDFRDRIADAPDENALYAFVAGELDMDISEAGPQ